MTNKGYDSEEGCGGRPRIFGVAKKCGGKLVFHQGLKVGSFIYLVTRLPLSLLDETDETVTPLGSVRPMWIRAKNL